MGNDVKNRSVVTINVGNKKYVRAIKITDNGIVNGLTYLEQKLGRNNELIKFLKNKQQNIDQQVFDIYGSQTAENEEFIDREFEAHKTKIEIEKRNKSIENVERLISCIKDARDDIKNLYDKCKILSPEQTIPKSIINEGVRPMLQSK